MIAITTATALAEIQHKTNALATIMSFSSDFLISDPQKNLVHQKLLTQLNFSEKKTISLKRH